jgi:hypothetical protein
MYWLKNGVRPGSPTNTISYGNTVTRAMLGRVRRHSFVIARNVDDSSREKNEPIGLNCAYLAASSDLPA